MGYLISGTKLYQPCEVTTSSPSRWRTTRTISPATGITRTPESPSWVTSSTGSSLAIAETKIRSNPA